MREAARRDMVKGKLQGFQLERVRKQSILGLSQEPEAHRKSVIRRILKNEAVTAASGHLVAQQARREAQRTN